MLVNQALIAVRLWTGQDVSGAVMRSVLEDLFQRLSRLCRRVVG